MPASEHKASTASDHESGSRPKFVIIGGGLAGLAALIEASRRLSKKGPSGSIILLEKEERVGGNSAKASTGINALTLDKGDTKDLFIQDTLKSGQGLSQEALVTTLVDSSEGALAFLDDLGVHLDKVVQGGGHSRPRTHGPPAGPVGGVIMKQLFITASSLDNVSIITRAKVTGLVKQGGAVTGVTYVQQVGGQPGKEEEKQVVADAVILATGGFGSNQELLQEVCPEAAACPTTNGPWATGDGLRLGRQVDGHLIHLDKVQVHPTGFVDPADPDAHTKFLAPEKWRACGGVMLNLQGKRFVDELQRRDVVSGAIKKQEGGRTYLVLGQAAAEDFGIGPLKFYESRGLVTQVPNAEGLAAHLGVPAEVVKEEIQSHNDAVIGTKPDPFGRTVFPTGTIDPDKPLFVAQAVPVVHYCMGGLAINSSAQVLNPSLQPIPGLFAAGEVTGGVHGANRLAGNSLLDCVVFGRQAAISALDCYYSSHSAL